MVSNDNLTYDLKKRINVVIVGQILCEIDGHLKSELSNQLYFDLDLFLDSELYSKLEFQIKDQFLWK